MRMIHRGKVDGGMLKFDNSERWRRAIRKLDGGRFELTFVREKSKRSLDQNAYLHAVPLPMLAEEFGYDKHEIPQLKLSLLGEWSGWVDRDREEVFTMKTFTPNKTSTSDLSTKEFSDFIDWLIRWAAKEHNVIIPLPDEVDLSVYDEQ